jgi:hypothetical protein
MGAPRIPRGDERPDARDGHQFIHRTETQTEAASVEIDAGDVPMSYREENGQVILSMSPEDYDELLITLGYAVGAALQANGHLLRRITPLLNRLNEGNPNYRPYQVEAKK